MKKRLPFIAMALVTAWSVWSYAQPAQGPHPPPSPPPSRKARARRARAPRRSTRKARSLRSQLDEVRHRHAALHRHGHQLRHPGGATTCSEGSRSPRGSRPGATRSPRRSRRRAHEQEAEGRAKTTRPSSRPRGGAQDGARVAWCAPARPSATASWREAEVKAERMRKDAEFLVEQELKQSAATSSARRSRQRCRSRRAPEEARTQADQERLAEDYLSDLGDQGRARSVQAQRSAS